MRERVDAIFDLVPLDEALRWSLCWSSREAAGQRAAVGWRVRVRVGARDLSYAAIHLDPPSPVIFTPGSMMPSEQGCMPSEQGGMPSE